MKIAIFRALQLGDILCALPAIILLKKAFPAAQLSYIGLPTMRDLLLRYSFIDHYIDFPGYKGLPEQIYDEQKTEPFTQDMQRMEFDLLLQMQGNGSVVNDFLSTWKPKRLAGFCSSSLAVTQNWLPYPYQLHEIDRHLELMRHIGLEPERPDRQLLFPLFKTDWENFELLKQSWRLNRYAIVHVGSRSNARRWPLKNFVVLARHLISHGLQLVLTGTRAEMTLVHEMERLLGNRRDVFNLAGKTDLGVLGCLVRQSTILVSNCTGISHVAAALKTKSLVLSLDGEPGRWAPLNQKLHHTYDACTPLDLTMLCQDLDALLADN